MTTACNIPASRDELRVWNRTQSRILTALLLLLPSAVAAQPCHSGEERTEKGIVVVHICAGTFTMGSHQSDKGLVLPDQGPAHQVTLSEFWIGKTEITNEQFRRYDSDHKGDGRLPAAIVSWNDAKAACEHFDGRLPTEAEWEYAARAGSHTTWSFGDDEKWLSEYAWYGGFEPHPVGTKKPNAWGLHDMYGNVWEWVADWYGSYTGEAQTDPRGPNAGTTRVVRGGGYFDSAFWLRSAFRFKFAPSGRDKKVGFRCAWDRGRHSCPRFDHIPAIYKAAREQLLGKDRLKNASGPLEGPYRVYAFALKPLILPDMHCEFSTLTDPEIRCERDVADDAAGMHAKEFYEKCLLTDGWGRAAISFRKSDIAVTVVAVPKKDKGPGRISVEFGEDYFDDFDDED